MSVTFHDLQQLDNPMNGARLETVAAITELFRSLRERKPFLFELRGSNGFMLTIGQLRQRAIQSQRRLAAVSDGGGR